MTRPRKRGLSAGNFHAVVIFPASNLEGKEPVVAFTIALERRQRNHNTKLGCAVVLIATDGLDNVPGFDSVGREIFSRLFPLSTCVAQDQSKSVRSRANRQVGSKRNEKVTVIHKRKDRCQKHDVFEDISLRQIVLVHRRPL